MDELSITERHDLREWKIALFGGRPLGIDRTGHELPPLPSEVWESYQKKKQQQKLSLSNTLPDGRSSNS